MRLQKLASVRVIGTSSAFFSLCGHITRIRASNDLLSTLRVAEEPVRNVTPHPHLADKGCEGFLPLKPAFVRVIATKSKVQQLQSKTSASVRLVAL